MLASYKGGGILCSGHVYLISDSCGGDGGCVASFERKEKLSLCSYSSIELISSMIKKPLYIISYIILWLLISVQGAFANPMVGFCFPFTHSLQGVRSYLNDLILPKDKIEMRNQINCIEISLSNSRRSLFEKYLRKKFIINRIYSEIDPAAVDSTSSGMAGKNCDLLVEKIEKADSGNSKIGIKRPLSAVLKESKSSGSSSSLAQLKLMSGKSGMIEVNGEKVNLKCRYIDDSKYEVEIFLTTKKGNISNTLSTTVLVARGNKVEIGKMVGNLSKQNRELDLNAKLLWERRTDKSVSLYNLSIR